MPLARTLPSSLADGVGALASTLPPAETSCEITSDRTARHVPDLRRIIEARLWIARLGERDVLGLWATDAVLGPDGAFVGPRVLPRTHSTARARIAFAVARHTCDERHPDPHAYHLFRLDPATEDSVDRLMIDLLPAHDWWADRLEALDAVTAEPNLEAVLTEAGVVEPEDLQTALGTDLGPAGRSLPTSPCEDVDGTIRRLAAGFVRSGPRSLAVPFVRRVPNE